LWGRWLRPVPSMRCPACGQEGWLHRHGSYHKYHFLHQITIVRVRCGHCRRTHAMIPSFSLPGSSVGSAEAEGYLMGRERGVGRGRAAVELLRRGMSEGYPKHLERMFATAITRAKALLVGQGQSRLQGLAWVHSVVGHAQHPLVELNRYCLAHGVNGVCFCRASILLFSSLPVSRGASHKGGSAERETTAVPSGP
jgi:hypothetical protein